MRGRKQELSTAKESQLDRDVAKPGGRGGKAEGKKKACTTTCVSVGGRLLDVGCGKGQRSQQLNNKKR